MLLYLFICYDDMEERKAAAFAVAAGTLAVHIAKAADIMTVAVLTKVNFPKREAGVRKFKEL